jgi:hypothetical protein
MLLEDKIALVTGSTHNIGLASARAFAREGAKGPQPNESEYFPQRRKGRKGKKVS